MDISAFLVSQQTDPQSRALAANALTPGMGGRGEEQQYDAAQGQQQEDPLAPDGAIPMPATTGGLDQAALNQGSMPQPPPDDHADDQQSFEDGGPVREFGELSENIEDRRDGKELNMRLGTHTPEYQEKTGQARDLAAVSGLGRSGMEGDGRVMKFDEGGALPMPEDMPGTEPPAYPPEDNAAMESDPRVALKAALDYGYNHHAVNRPIPDEMQEPDVRDMMHGAGATSFAQAEHALKMFNGDSAKTIGAVYDFYNKQGPAEPERLGNKAGDDDPSKFETLSPIKQMTGDPGPEGGAGAQAAWGVLQQIRKGVGSLFAGARAADDHGNVQLAAKLAGEALTRLPDGTTVNINALPNGELGVTTSTGYKTTLDKDGLHRLATMPFDQLVHMGVDHALQSVVPASINMEQARAVRARMTRQDEEQGLSPDGSGAPAQQPAPPRDPNVPGPNEPITIVRGGGLPHRNASAYSPTTTQRVNRETGQVIPETTEHERIETGKNQMHRDVATITAKGRQDAQGGANGMAKQNPDAEKRLTVEQYLRYLGPPLDKNGKPDPVAYEALRKRISDEYDAGRIKPGQQPGQQAAPRPAPAPTPQGGKSPPPVGAVMNGFRYMGGPPGNQASWQRVQ